ncbi:unnamed protein product [Soboliphyme baturini]|uniref:SAM_MT_RSMB_NOP domain-containing protein n=1 Tax=Soboliphyme baturini TaxID=241478 RepID=A0A183IWB1_9BILA|nr:unnamed protein product [Soboliphyme baturini]
MYATRNHYVPSVTVHALIPDVLIISGSGPHALSRRETEIYVDVSCGKSVMRGADLYASGIMGSNRDFRVDEVVSVLMDIDARCRRGVKRPYEGRCVFLGNGVTHQSRRDIFKISPPEKPKGLGVFMVEKVWNNPKLYGLIEDWGFPQNLPSVVCGHVLDPQPGETVLDMCAAPGGKSTHLAILMKDQGRVVCIDDRKIRLREVLQNASALSLRSIEAYKMDAVNLVNEPEKRRKAVPTNSPPFLPETFDRILLDVPCSGLGQRPLLFEQNPNQIRSLPVIQRKLLKSAYRLLKKEGTLVYSTCTLREEENEHMVSWALENFADLKLSRQVSKSRPLFRE